MTELSGVTGITPLGPMGLVYTPIAGMAITLDLPRASNIVAYYNVMSRDITVGSHSLAYRLQVGPTIGADTSVYISMISCFLRIN